MLATKEIVLSREGEEPKFHTVNCNPFSIGSAPVSDLQLDGKSIPHHQCDIIETETGFELLDHSGKGTSVNGKKVKSAELSDKSVIKIGGYRLHLRDIKSGFEIDNTITHLGDDKKSRDSIENVLSLVGKSPSGPIKVVLNAMQLTIGSKDNNDLIIKDPCVSGRHCEITSLETPGIWHVSDKGSKNGTFVNEENIKRAKKKLYPGMVIRVGDTNLRVVAGRDDVDYPSYYGIISEDPAMEKSFEQIDGAAPSNEPVLITGETGSGKENAARAIHQASKRSSNKLVVFDCATAEQNLIDSALFGHKKGSFTGAEEDRIGFFEDADGGTLFLDEIGELPLKLQQKLLRAIENKEIVRIGENDPRKVDTSRIPSFDHTTSNTRLKELYC